MCLRRSWKSCADSDKLGRSATPRRYHFAPSLRVPQRATSMPSASAIAALASMRAVGFVGAVGVGHLDVVRLVPGHHLVARHAVGHGVHDRPLRRRGVPAALGFVRAAARRRRPGRGPSSAGRPRCRCGDQTISPGLRMPLSVPPPRRKYIAGWRSLVAPAQPPMKCAGGARAADQEHPDVLVDRAASGRQSPQRRSCSVFSTGWPIALCTR